MFRTWPRQMTREEYIESVAQFLEWLNEQGSVVMAGLDFLPDYREMAEVYVAEMEHPTDPADERIGALTEARRLHAQEYEELQRDEYAYPGPRL